MNKENPAGGMGFGVAGERAAGQSGRAEQKQGSYLVGRGEQVCRAVNECLQGSTTLAAASCSPRALHVGFVVVLSLIWDISKWV